MEAVIRLSALAVVAAVLCVVVRQQEKPLALLLSLAACSVILLAALEFFSPILSVVEKLRDLSGLNEAVTAPLLKVTGIGLLTQVAAGVCEDAEEKTLGKAVEIGGSVLAVYAALPLLSAVLELMEEMLGG